MPQPLTAGGSYEVVPPTGQYKGMGDMSTDSTLNVGNSPFLNQPNDAELQSMWDQLVQATKNQVGPNAQGLTTNSPYLPLSSLPLNMQITSFFSSNGGLLLAAGGILVMALVLSKKR